MEAIIICLYPIDELEMSAFYERKADNTTRKRLRDFNPDYDDWRP